MFNTLGRCIWVGIILIACAVQASAGTYSHPSGFSLTYPDGWIAVSRESLSEKHDEALPPELKQWIDKNNIDLNRIAVYLTRQGEAQSPENVNVVIEPQQVPTSGNAATDYGNHLAKTIRDMGATVTGVHCRAEKIGDRDVLLADYNMQFHGVEPAFHQRQVLLPGGGKTFIITCTATTETYSRYQPVFDSVIASFTAPPPEQTGFNLESILNGAFGFSIVGGVIALLVVLVLKATGQLK